MKRGLLVEEGRLTGEGCWFWKRKLKLQWLQGKGGITKEKRVESSIALELEAPGTQVGW